MTPDEAIANINRYNRFNVLMEMVQECLKIDHPKTLGELAEGMKQIQLDYQSSVSYMRENFKPEGTNHVPDNEGDNKPDLN